MEVNLQNNPPLSAKSLLGKVVAIGLPHQVTVLFWFGQSGEGDYPNFGEKKNASEVDQESKLRNVGFTALAGTGHILGLSTSPLL